MYESLILKGPRFVRHNGFIMAELMFLPCQESSESDIPPFLLFHSQLDLKSTDLINQSSCDDMTRKDLLIPD